MGPGLQIVLTSMVVAWGLRLSIFLLLRYEIFALFQREFGPEIDIIVLFVSLQSLAAVEVDVSL